MPNKLLGQHFLNDTQGTITKKMIAALTPAEGETIIEVGPGRGALTRPLAAACKKSGARLIAIEKDVRLAAALEEEFKKSSAGSDVQIIAGDALEVLGSNRALSRKTTGARYKVIGNIPYYLTGHLLRIIGERKDLPAICIFMAQKEVAERIIAEPPEMNRLAASVQFWAEPKIIASVSRENFTPAPNVDSAIISLTARTQKPSAAETKRYYAALHALFAQPRKTILNNLAARAEEKGMQNGKHADSEKLFALHLDPGMRPQDLTVDEVNAVARAFF